MTLASRTRSYSILILLLALLLSTVAPAAAQRNESFDPALAAELQQVLDQTVADEVAPGVVLTVIVPGQGRWSGASGLADVESGAPALPDTRFRVASITKMFVAVVALQLVEEGWLRLDDSVERWLPGLVPSGDQISVQQLLNHTSGIPDYLTGAFDDEVFADPWRHWAPEELVAFGMHYDPYFAPGEGWHYSNTNYVLLGMIIERVTGQPLHHEIRWRIIEKLGLTNTFFASVEPVQGPMLRGYIGSRDMTDLDMSFAWAAGNLVSNNEDLTHFMTGLFGGRLLRPESLGLMLNTVSARNGLWASDDLAYGLGLIQDVFYMPDHADLVLGHTGALTGYRSAIWYLPERGIIIAVGLNSMYASVNDVTLNVLSTLHAHLN